MWLWLWTYKHWRDNTRGTEGTIYSVLFLRSPSSRCLQKLHWGRINCHNVTVKRRVYTHTESTWSVINPVVWVKPHTLLGTYRPGLFCLFHTHTQSYSVYTSHRSVHQRDSYLCMTRIYYVWLNVTLWLNPLDIDVFCQLNFLTIISEIQQIRKQYWNLPIRKNCSEGSWNLINWWKWAVGR